jgi:predicted lipoprotein with Yx(FWY)xxD motif
MTRLALRLSAIAGVTSLATAGGALWTGPVQADAAGSHRLRGTVHVAKLSIGPVLVDASGRTLYVFSPDARKTPTCTRTCASFWPPLLVRHRPVAGSGVKKSLLGTVRTAAGKLQVTYDHWPLYTFVEDTAPGQAHGEGLTQFGGKWATIKASGRPPFESASSSGGSSPGGGYGGGYGIAGGSSGSVSSSVSPVTSAPASAPSTSGSGGSSSGW